MSAYLRTVLLSGFLLGMVMHAPAQAAGSYDFLAAPEIDLNRIFRLDKATGEVGACQFGGIAGRRHALLPARPGRRATGFQRLRTCFIAT